MPRLTSPDVNALVLFFESSYQMLCRVGTNGVLLHSSVHRIEGGVVRLTSERPVCDG